MTNSPLAQTILSFLRKNHPQQAFSPPAADHNLFELTLLNSSEFIELIQLLEEQSGIMLDFTRIDPAALATIQGLLAAFTADDDPTL
ncbi:hypothetical protein [Candidatus Magnetaquicoccus inordinatus]|uniref:hypothetical protein n=1 Tax=Candidatus Magnetaquicoccus inordinatus TaxID=2496818 RepID=UPI00102BA2F8|nr:hypothetical protein [Candidatus Magnetaquicoccus inordinatus]